MPIQQTRFTIKRRISTLFVNFINIVNHAGITKRLSYFGNCLQQMQVIN